jgi:hypothetical protein
LVGLGVDQINEIINDNYAAANVSQPARRNKDIYSIPEADLHS